MSRSYTYALSFDETPAGVGIESNRSSVKGISSSLEPLYQCAESKLYTCDFYGAAAVCKHRFAKAYRHPTLDAKLREQRTAREARALVRCHKAGIRVPVVYGVETRSCKIFMERIPGGTVKDALDVAYAAMKASHPPAASPEEKHDTPTPAVRRLLCGIGELVGLMHNIDVIHGDLTTSNFMTMLPPQQAGAMAPTAAAPTSDGALARPRDRDGIVVIDLGLVTDKNSPEERAVDLYVLERAITSTHPFLETFAARVILEGYGRTVDPKKGKATMARLEAVRARGRKRSMVG